MPIIVYGTLPDEPTAPTPELAQVEARTEEDATTPETYEEN